MSVWSRLDRFRPLASYPVAGARIPLAAGHTLYFDDMVDYSRVFSDPEHPGTISLHITAIRAVVDENTADASVTVERCVLSGTGHQLLGQSASAAHTQCATLSPFRTGTVKLGYDPGDVDIVVAIQPKHAGVTDVQGVRVSFTAGWRSGTQHAGVQATTLTR